jgi:8-oxo-dGTP pyrophosphatase MutT (NUDIX family)
MTLPVIHRVTTLDLAVRTYWWPFAIERREDIDAYFAAEQCKRPGLWNGRVLLGRNAAFADGRFNADYFETDFASFLAWRDWGFPDPDVFNGFGMGALLSRDGAFVLGEMGQHTSNAGRIYFPSGTPDPDDIKGDTLDIAGSVVREVEEETGLTPADFVAEPYFDCVFTGVAVAVMQILRVDLPGDTLRARIEANLALQPRPELSAIHLVRGPDDLTSAMPRFVTAFLDQQFRA